jgi:hypothetical protein
MDVLLTPEVRPFSVALLVLVGILAVELIGLVAGLSVGAWLDHGLGHLGDAPHAEAAGLPGWMGAAFGWLNVGRVPLLVLVMIWLGAFAAVGFLLQALAQRLLGALPVPAAVAAAALAALPLGRLGSRLVARVIPQDESYAVSNDDLIGRTAEVLLGPLDEGRPGRVRVLDAYDNWHFLPARAARGEGPFAIGEEVLLVDRDAVSFLVISLGP